MAAPQSVQSCKTMVQKCGSNSSGWNLKSRNEQPPKSQSQALLSLKFKQLWSNTLNHAETELFDVLG
jgi:hypothetical protein